MSNDQEARPRKDNGQLKAEVVTAGVDYITATAKAGDQARALWEVGYSLMAERRAIGCDPHPFQWHDYSGLECGGATVAERESDTLVRISGALAASNWRSVFDKADNVSRLDLQVTARFPEPVHDVAHHAFITASALSNARGRGLDIHLHVHNHPGHSVELGKRTSQWFGRVYDKHSESGDAAFRNCWRWELELKQKRSLKAAGYLRHSPDEARAVEEAVYEEFVRRGVIIPWTVATPRGLPAPAARDTDDERRLKWLKEQIAPVVGKLLARVPEARVKKAVGLYDVRDRVTGLETSPQTGDGQA